MADQTAFPLRLPVILFVQKDIVDPATGLHSYEGYLTVEIPGKGECLPIFESRNAAEIFFSEQRPGPAHGVHLRTEADVLRTLESAQQDGVQWVAVEPLGDLQRTRYHRIADLLNYRRQA